MKEMEKMEANCLIVRCETLRKVFGERFWNDTEKVVCIPTNRIWHDEWSALEREGMDVCSARAVQYLIAEL